MFSPLNHQNGATLNTSSVDFLLWPIWRNLSDCWETVGYCTKAITIVHDNYVILIILNFDHTESVTLKWMCVALV